MQGMQLFGPPLYWQIRGGVKSGKRKVVWGNEFQIELELETEN